MSQNFFVKMDDSCVFHIEKFDCYFRPIYKSYVNVNALFVDLGFIQKCFYRDLSTCWKIYRWFRLQDMPLLKTFELTAFLSQTLVVWMGKSLTACCRDVNFDWLSATNQWPHHLKGFTGATSATQCSRIKNSLCKFVGENQIIFCNVNGL